MIQGMYFNCYLQATRYTYCLCTGCEPQYSPFSASRSTPQG